ncbi:CPBP family intramembrane glutamic endopeptidase [Cytobacillus sp. FJAT-54145]|uniref:CPBP family intramembrane glutamic endopeptidase n=1 Tax=Cytobacillus spartinae TaxID=3299023 RepID=A0ABW6KFY1_9BACI
MKNKYSDLINDLSDRELIFHLMATQILLVVISFILGIFLFESFTEFDSLFVWTDPTILYVGGLAGLLVVLLDIGLMRILPKSYYDDGGLNKKLFANKSILQIALISIMVATTEEILFRGVLQTHFGLFVSSIIFALIHYRYLFNWFLFTNIIVLSFFIGYIYLLTGNLLVTIFMHFVIDFLLGIVIKFSNKKKLDEQEVIEHE